MKVLRIGHILDRSRFAPFEGTVKNRGRYTVENVNQLPMMLKELEGVEEVEVYVESDFRLGLPFLSRFDQIEKNEGLVERDLLRFMVKNQGVRRQVSFAFEDSQR